MCVCVCEYANQKLLISQKESSIVQAKYMYSDSWGWSELSNVTFVTMLSKLASNRNVLLVHWAVSCWMWVNITAAEAQECDSSAVCAAAAASEAVVLDRYSFVISDLFNRSKAVTTQSLSLWYRYQFQVLGKDYMWMTETIMHKPMIHPSPGRSVPNKPVYCTVLTVASDIYLCNRQL